MIPSKSFVLMTGNATSDSDRNHFRECFLAERKELVKQQLLEEEKNPDGLVWWPSILPIDPLAPPEDNYPQRLDGSKL